MYHVMLYILPHVGNVSRYVVYIAPCRLYITLCCIYCLMSVMFHVMLYILPHVGNVSCYVVYIVPCR